MRVKVFIMILCVTCVFSALCCLPSAYASSITTEMIDEFNMAHNIQNGYYWTDSTNNSTKYIAHPNAARDGKEWFGYDYPIGQFGQCLGYAMYVGKELTGVNPWEKWDLIDSQAKFDAAGGKLKVGDIIRAGGHAAIVRSVDSSGLAKFDQCCGGEQWLLRIDTGFAGASTGGANFSSAGNTVDQIIGNKWYYEGSIGSDKTYVILRAPDNFHAEFSSGQDNSNNQFASLFAEFLYAESSYYQGDGNSHAVKAEPYANCDIHSIQTVCTYTDEIFLISGAYLNEHGNVWYSLADGTGYIYSGDVIYVGSAATVSWSGMDSFYGKTFPHGKGQEIGGSIFCTNNMKSITAEFYAGKSCWAYPVSVNVSGQSFDLLYSDINTQMKFGSLPSGNYSLVFTIEYNTNNNQESCSEQIVCPFTIE